MYAGLICTNSAYGMLCPTCILTVPTNVEELQINLSGNQCTVCKLAESMLQFASLILAHTMEKKVPRPKPLLTPKSTHSIS